MNTKQSSKAYQQGVVSIIVNTLLFVAKYYAGIVSGSVAIITDAWHTISDSLSSVVLIIGTKIADKPADREHPYGHGRVELVTAMIIGILLVIVGFKFLSESVEKLSSNQSAHFGLLAIIVTIASIILNELLAQYAFFLARMTDKSSLRADGWHHRSDAISSIVILIGIGVGQYYWWIDGAMGIIMSLFIFYASYSIMKDAISPLLGEQPDTSLVKKIKIICDSIAMMPIMAHHFHIHRYGSHAELTFHIVLEGTFKLSNAHSLADKIEKKIKEDLAIEATIHIDPADEPDTLTDLEKDESI